MQPVYDRTARDLAAVKESVIALHTDDGPVTWWSAQDLRTWSSRPWNQDGKQLPLVYHAQVRVDVRFRDFTALSRWVAQHTNETEGFGVGRVEWTLTDDRRKELLRQVRTEAVQDAARRAQQYADALDLGAVRPVAIADAGMLGSGMARGRSAEMDLMAAPGSAPDVELAPDEIKVSAAVDARFVAG